MARRQLIAKPVGGGMSSGARVSCLIVVAATAVVGCPHAIPYLYVSPNGTGVEVESSAPIEVRGHLGLVQNVATNISAETPHHTVRMVRDPTDPQGGLKISVTSQSGEPLKLQITQEPLAEPGYGDCRAYYRDGQDDALYFFDVCPGSVARDYIITFEALNRTGVHTSITIPYAVHRAGTAWHVDTL